CARYYGSSFYYFDYW
nr:immunoglobulin heavy chain junction region [Mus musculus]MBK4195286.1 immunoglobulin heavy chain junction region [Mus musculus]